MAAVDHADRVIRTLVGAPTARLAVLIDADNASASVVKELLEEVAKYGTATVKRA